MIFLMYFFVFVSATILLYFGIVAASVAAANKQQVLSSSSTSILLFFAPVVPLFKRLNRWLVKFEFFVRYRKGLAQKLDYANITAKTDVDSFIVYQELVGFIFMAVSLVLLPKLDVSGVLGVLFLPVYLFVFWIAGFVVIYLYLLNQISARRVAIAKGWPFLLDLVSISVFAGMDFVQAIERVVERGKRSDPLAQEFEGFINELRLGKRRTDALLAMGRRLDIAAINSVLIDIVQAEQMGTPLSAVLKLEAQDYRQRRAQLAEKKAMEAPVKMLFPLLFFIFPSVFLVLLGPMLIQFMGGALK